MAQNFLRGAGVGLTDRVREKSGATASALFTQQPLILRRALAPRAYHAAPTSFGAHATDLPLTLPAAPSLWRQHVVLYNKQASKQASTPRDR